MKIIDCFAAGVGVVSTRKGIEGIPVEPGRHALVVDDWDEMIDAITDLLRDDVRRTQLADAGVELAGTLDWSAVGRKFRELYAKLV
jgi:glycosyltransferase involved in cell wall biosynthesis